MRLEHSSIRRECRKGIHDEEGIFHQDFNSRDLLLNMAKERITRRTMVHVYRLKSIFRPCGIRSSLSPVVRTSSVTLAYSGSLTPLRTDAYMRTS